MSKISMHTFKIYLMRVLGCIIAFGASALGSLHSANAAASEPLCGQGGAVSTFLWPNTSDDFPVLLSYATVNGNDITGPSGFAGVATHEGRSTFNSVWCELGEDKTYNDAHMCVPFGSGFSYYNTKNGLKGVCMSSGVIFQYKDIKDFVEVSGTTGTGSQLYHFTYDQVGLTVVGVYKKFMYDQFVVWAQTSGCSFGSSSYVTLFSSMTSETTSCNDNCQKVNDIRFPYIGNDIPCCPSTASLGNDIKPQRSDNNLPDTACYIPAGTYHDDSGTFKYTTHCQYTFGT